LRETAAHILAHICAAPALLRIVDALEDDADRLAHDLSEQDRKGMFFDPNTRLSSRHLDGRSRIRRRGS
jgi:hypothetical protein